MKNFTQINRALAAKKKIFTLLTAILFAGSMFAADAIHYTATISKDAGAGGQDAYERPTVVWTTTDGKITITQFKGLGANPNASYKGRIYTGNFASFKAASGYVIDTIIVSVDGSNFGTTPYAGTDTASNKVTENTTDVDARLYLTSGAKDTLINAKGEDLLEFFLQNTFKDSGAKQLRFTSIYIAYTKLASVDPEVTAGDVDFGTFIPEVSSATQDLSVLGSNLSGAIEATLEDGSNFSVSGSLTAEGGTLTVALTNTAAGDYADKIQFRVGGVLLAESNVTAHVVNPAGKGTKDDPFTVADVVALNNSLSGEKYWVIGYIVGCAANGGAISTGDPLDSNIAIGDAADQTESLVPVQLPQGDIRTALNVKDNAGNIGKQVKVHGTLEAYFQFSGVKNVDDYEMISTGIFDTEVEGKTVKFMENGQIVILKNGVRFNVLGAQL